METPFVWFDLRTKDADASRSFYAQLFGWDIADVPAGEATLTMVGGETPWATVVPDGGDRLGWFPYVRVEDLDAATEKAEELGATTLQTATEGLARTYTVINEPGGAVFALFHPRT